MNAQGSGGRLAGRVVVLTGGRVRHRPGRRRFASPGRARRRSSAAAVRPRSTTRSPRSRMRAGGRRGSPSTSGSPSPPCAPRRGGRELGGRLDGVVSCAGTFPSAPFTELRDAEWEEAIAMNLGAPMRVARRPVPTLARRVAMVSVRPSTPTSGANLLWHARTTRRRKPFSSGYAPTRGGLAPQGIRACGCRAWRRGHRHARGVERGPADIEAWLERFVPLRRLAAPTRSPRSTPSSCPRPMRPYVTGRCSWAESARRRLMSPRGGPPVEAKAASSDPGRSARAGARA